MEKVELKNVQEGIMEIQDGCTTIVDKFSELEKDIEVYKNENESRWNLYYVNKKETNDKLIEMDKEIKRNKNFINLKTDSIWGHISATVPYLRRDVDKLKKELNVSYKIIGIIVLLDLIADILRLL